MAKQLQIPGTGKLGRPRTLTDAQRREQWRAKSARYREREKARVKRLEELQRVCERVMKVWRTEGRFMDDTLERAIVAARDGGDA